MRGFLISDNRDTLIGMRLAGTEGVIAHEPQEVLDALRQAMHETDIAVIYLTEKLANLCTAEVQEIKERGSVPLLVIIPDRHGKSDMTGAISRYLAETVGIHI